MKLFVCSYCANVVYFENETCERCANRLGYHQEANRMFALEPDEGAWTSVGDVERRFRFCANAEHEACNWIIPVEADGELCAACRHNRTIPDLSVARNLSLWQRLERAKHHMFYGLLRLELPLTARLEDPENGLAFDDLGVSPDGGMVKTGHQNGVITVNLAEADDATREKMRTDLGEPYRTLLGHFRHEIGHYFWDRLVRDGGHLDEFREIFGNEEQSYDEALQAYYANGAPADWRSNFVSAYASAHPWEDFAETWAHFLHIVDTLEMAGSFGIRIDPVVTDNAAYSAEVDFNPHDVPSVGQLVRHWLPIAGAVNAINRCMGQPDLYPFVLTPAVIRKLGFILDLVHQAGHAESERFEETAQLA